jgi:hypothetical protein
MTPFIKVERSVAARMERRQGLLEQPCEYFRKFFGGRVPSLAEKAMCVEAMLAQTDRLQVYENDLYHVEIDSDSAPFIHLDIHRHDLSPCKNWRHFQQIKNELVGPEHEAVEIFPAESRLVDTANQYHLWVHASPSYRLPMGFRDRFVPPKPMTYTRYEAVPDGRVAVGASS